MYFRLNFKGKTLNFFLQQVTICSFIVSAKEKKLFLLGSPSDSPKRTIPQKRNTAHDAGNMNIIEVKVQHNKERESYLSANANEIVLPLVL
jgi:hypothetical protein